MNNYERAIFFKNEEILPREKARYTWASQFVKEGDRVLEIGCSNGYGTRLLPNKIQYSGMDYDSTIIQEARKDYEDKNHSFFCGDINTTDFKLLGNFDVIMAFEVIEHLENGLEIVEELKKHCKTLLVTVPYKEPPGLWGEHHKLHQLDESHFKDFSYDYINEFGAIVKRPDTRTFNLIIMRHSKEILASISTRGRTNSTLPAAIMSVATQTLKPDKLVIFDDNTEKVDLRNIPIYKQLFQMLDYQGIKWEVIFGACKGQHFNHQIANKMGYKFVWRIDDDNVAESDVLEKLYAQMDGLTGAVGGSVLVPGDDVQEWQKGENKIDDVKSYNAQWFPITETKEVEHLHCSFLYRAGIMDYNLALSRVAHTEETLFTYGIYQEGYKVKLTPCITWHFRNPEGGIRDGQKEMFDHDEQIFLGIRKYGKIFVLNNGIGDHIIFRSLLPKIKAKYPKYTLAVCHPQVFDGENIISIAEAESLLGNLDNFNIYKWCIDNNHKVELIEAYKLLYKL